MNGSAGQSGIEPDVLISYGAAAIGAAVLLATVIAWIYRGKAENPKVMLAVVGIAFLLMTFTFWRTFGITYSGDEGFKAEFEQFETHVASLKEGALSEINANIRELEEATKQANFSTAALQSETKNHADRITELNRASVEAKTAREELSEAVRRAETEQAVLKEQIPEMATAIREARFLLEELERETDKKFEDVNQKFAKALEIIQGAQAGGRLLTAAEKEEIAPAMKEAEREDTVFALLLLAWNFFFDGKYDDVVRLASRAIDEDERASEAYFVRGAAYYGDGQPSKALPDYNKAIELNPEFVEAYINRSSIYRDHGEREKALADSNKAIELYPEYATAYNNRGTVYFDQGNREKALADFDKAIELNPEYATAYSNRGIAYNVPGEREKALADSNKAIELNPEYATAYYNRGTVYIDQGNREKALADYDKAIELNPKLAIAYFVRAFVYVDQGEEEKALADFDKAFELNPKLEEAIATGRLPSTN